MASLAGIGVSWYTALENGHAQGVSEPTLLAIADVLRLSESERQYVIALSRRPGPNEEESPELLLIEAMHAVTFPAYIITAAWDVLDCNAAFQRVWGVNRSELPFNAIDRLFMDPAARRMHGDHFIGNITPVVAMLRSGLGRRPHLKTLDRLRDRLLRDETIRSIWEDYQVSSPFVETGAQIESPLGTFRYRALNLPVPGAAHGIVIQVPDNPSQKLISGDRPSAHVAKPSSKN